MPTLADLWAAMQKAHLVDDPRYEALVNAVSEPCPPAQLAISHHHPKERDCVGTGRLLRLYPDVPGAVSGAIGWAARAITHDMSNWDRWAKVYQIAGSCDDPATIAAALAAIKEVAHAG